jgi:hypothetical protein
LCRLPGKDERSEEFEEEKEQEAVMVEGEK